MSNPSLPRSLVSAYFDGEVSADERASVSRAAEKSPVVQQMLDDYSQISASLKSLKESVPSPNLRDAVLAQIQPRTVQPLSTMSPPTRRRVPIAAVGLSTLAAGLLLLLWPSWPVPDRGVQVARQNVGLRPESSLSREPFSAAGHAELDQTSTLLANSTAATESAPTANAEPIANDATPNETRTAAIPEEWLRQHAKDHRVPQPGDVMNYMLEVADETVVIPVTVVDVQRTAGEIRVLLASHGIQPLTSDNDTTAPPTLDASSVAILVESDWERLPSVMDALNTQGLDVSGYVESSPTAKRMILAQNSLEAQAKPPSAASSSAKDTIASRRLPSAAAPHSGEALKESASLTEVLRGLFFEAPVTDEFVEEIELRQHAMSEEPALADTADSSAAEGLPAEQDSGAVKRYGVPLASEAPARVVFLIKKQGRTP